MSSPERNLQLAVTTWCKAQPPEGFWWFKIHGGPYQRAGVPDLLLCLQGRLVAIELKAPGARPTALQSAELAKLARAGAVTAVIDSMADFRSLMGRLRGGT